MYLAKGVYEGHKMDLSSNGLVRSPQVHGGVVAFQGRSHKDNVKLLGYNVSRFAK